MARTKSAREEQFAELVATWQKAKNDYYGCFTPLDPKDEYLLWMHVKRGDKETVEYVAEHIWDMITRMSKFARYRRGGERIITYNEAQSILARHPLPEGKDITLRDLMERYVEKWGPRAFAVKGVLPPGPKEQFYEELCMLHKPWEEATDEWAAAIAISCSPDMFGLTKGETEDLAARAAAYIRSLDNPWQWIRESAKVYWRATIEETRDLTGVQVRVWGLPHKPIIAAALSYKDLKDTWQHPEYHLEVFEVCPRLVHDGNEWYEDATARATELAEQKTQELLEARRDVLRSLRRVLDEE